MRTKQFKTILTISVLAFSLFLISADKTDKKDERAELESHLRNFTSAISKIERNFPGELKIEDNIEYSVQRMLHTLDPHSAYSNPEHYQRQQEDHEGHFYGIGATISLRNQRVTVLSPLQGGPSYRLGIRTGDIIDKIDGESTVGLSVTEAVSRLRGPEGEPVKLTIRRPGHPEPLEFTVIREKITENAVPHVFMVSKDTGFIKLTAFSRIAEKELLEAIEDLKAKGMKKLILDLRDNPGGLLKQALLTTNVFLDDKLVVSIKGRKEFKATELSTEKKAAAPDIPLVVLVNNSSASASEILAGAVQDYDRGLLVGEPTFGKGLVQSTFLLSNGGALFLTTSKYYTPSGRLIQRKYAGIYDYYVDSRNEREKAPPLGKQYKTVTGRIVYSGQGIKPDVEADDNYNTFIGTIFVKSHFFNFAQQYVSSHPNITKDMPIDDKLIGEFKEYLKKEKFEFTEKEMKENIEQIKYQLANNIFRHRWDATEGIKHALKYDAQFRKAMTLFDDATALLKRSSVVR